MKPVTPTPGPWHTESVEAERNVLVYGKGRKRGQHKQLVAQVWSGHEASFAVAQANAQLIAAAPAMLAALKAAAEVIALGHHLNDERDANPALDAIVKVIRLAGGEVPT